MLEFFPTKLDRDFFRHLGIVVKERPEVDPDRIFFKSLIDCFDIFYDIVCGINKKAGYHTIPSFWLVFINLHKFTCNHREIVIILHHIIGINVWDFVHCKWVLELQIIAKCMYKRLNLKLIYFSCLIENEI
jgi:hypothetical protein